MLELFSLLFLVLLICYEEVVKIMTKKKDAGYVPPKLPVKPLKIGERGFVPPKQPVKPLEKPNKK